MAARFDAATLDRTSFHPAKEVIAGLNGVCMGVTLVTTSEYGYEGVHDDHEGFFVAQGVGYALLDGEEVSIDSNTFLLVPAGTRHCFRKLPEGQDVKLLWFHAPSR